MSQRGFRMSTNSSQGLAKAEISETSSINHHSLLRAVMRGSDREKLNIAYLKDLSKLPDTECNPPEMNEAIQSLVRYIKEQEVFGTGTSHTLSKSSSVATKAFTEHKEIKTHRDNLVKEQEYLREEILGLAERLKSLEALRDCLGLEEEGVVETTGRKRWKKFQMNKLKSQKKTVQEALIEMGLKEKLTSHKKVEMNDIDVQQRHLELIQAQAKSIEELNKFELLQLKKPKYTLLLNKILEHKEPHESNEMKMLKKVTRKINLLYAKINDVDMETKAHQKSFGAKKRHLIAANLELAGQIHELVEKVNRAKTYHAFTETDIPYANAREFLEANPVPYNFSSVIKDYKLMDVLQ